MLSEFALSIWLEPRKVRKRFNDPNSMNFGIVRRIGNPNSKEDKIGARIRERDFDLW